VQPEQDEKPAKTYVFDVVFSLHTFTRSIEVGDAPDLIYKDNRESRAFCFDRYRLSFYLPSIINEIGKKRCSHTTRGNFFIVEIIDESGLKIEYEIFFDVSNRSSKNAPMLLYIQSTYMRDARSVRYRPQFKKISFSVIAYNRLHNKPIKRPR
jgi:hypothetical protein